MLKLTPILLAVLYGLILWRFSAWKLARDLDRSSHPLKAPGLDPVLERLAKALDLPKVHVFVQDIDAVNGLAAPDGRIFITRGFLDKLHAKEVSAEEIAGVVAHELGHVALGHARRRMIDFSGQNAIRATLGMVLGRLLPGIGAYLANLLTSLLAARLSRQDEFEADAYASALLVKAGIGTEAQTSLFRKLDTLTGAGARPPAWLMSHPPTDARIRAIEARAASWSKG